MNIVVSQHGKTTSFSLMDGDIIVGTRSTKTMAYTAALVGVLSFHTNYGLIEADGHYAVEAEENPQLKVISWHLTSAAAAKAATTPTYVKFYRNLKVVTL